jgi:rhamnogalacturonyl hydrolase YesR
VLPLIDPNRALNDALKVVEDADFNGYSKHDGLNARWLERLAGDSRVPRLIAIQSVMRSPFHIRPLIGVEKARNPKGIGLLSRAYLARYRLTGEAEFLERARTLLDWLLENTAPSWEAPCWGYPYPWQDVGFFAPRHYPNRVVTCFVVQGLLDGYEVMGDEPYLEAASGAVKFLVEAPRTLFEDKKHRCVSYVPSESIDWIVMDVSVLVGAAAARLAALTGDSALMEESSRLVRYVVSKQTDYGAWYYAEPPSASHITHDNYHTGFILDAILAYTQASGSNEFSENYDRGLRYYRDNLFEDDGAPRFMNDKQYPYDIHGAAQGIITFSLAQRYQDVGGDIATRIMNWTLREMFDEQSGWFHYQKWQFFKTRIRLLRWCQAWMSLALACYLENVGVRS